MYTQIKKKLASDFKSKKRRVVEKITDFYESTLPDPNAFCSPPSPPPILYREENPRTYIRDYSLPSTSERKTPSPSQFPESDRVKLSPRVEQNRRPKTISYAHLLKEKYNAKSNKCSCIEDALKEKAPAVQTFIRSQFCHKSRQIWSESEKKVFLKLYYKSPTCFRELQAMGFSVPHNSTIQRWHSQISFLPGISQHILELLKERCSNMNALDKRCVILFDEMAIKVEIEYDSKEDLVYGFRDLGNGNRSGDIASSALLLMVRGTNLNWKQTIAYYIGKVSADDLKAIISEAISALLSIGLDVKAMTCDQSSVNRSLFKKFECTTDKPFTEINNKKIVMLFDPPHLIKSVRNCLLKADIQVDNKFISWNILKKIFNADCNNTLKVCFKLTERHIFPDSFDKLNVKLATQVFSNNVSTGIELGIALNVYNEDEIQTARCTADAFRKLNNLFDNLTV